MFVARCDRRRGGWGSLAGMAPVHQLLGFFDGVASLAVRVDGAQCHEDERPTSALLEAYADNLGPVRHDIAYRQRVLESDRTCSPHPSGQRARRKQVASSRMSVAADLGLRTYGQEIQPLIERRQSIAGASTDIRAFKSCGE